MITNTNSKRLFLVPLILTWLVWRSKAVLHDGDPAEDKEFDLAAAVRACANSNPKMKQFCIQDVLATGDLDIAEDPLYK